jgi:hypothetical protein
MSRTSFCGGLLTRAFVYRLAVVTSGVALLGGCATGLPHRRPGSDITVRETGESRALRYFLAPCDRPADSVSVRPRDTVDCGRTMPDTAAVRDPQKTGSAPTTP